MAITSGELLSVKDIIKRFKICKQTIYNWIATGRMPQPTRLSKRVVRWRAEQIEKWIDSEELNQT